MKTCLWLHSVGHGAALLVLSALPAAAVSVPADSLLAFDIDIARFRMADSTALAEVYVGVPRHQLRFVPAAGRWQASFACEVAIVSADSELFRHRWQAHDTAGDREEIKRGQMLFTQSRFQMPAGEYKFVVRVQDENGKAFGTRLLHLEVDHFPSARLCLSDLQFACLIEKDTTASIFHKNGFKVVPNPAAVYGTGMPLLYTYSEIYNLSFPSDSNYAVSYRILDGNGREAKTMPLKLHGIVGRSLVEVNAINIVSLPSGSYVLEQRVRDHTTAQEAANHRKFFVLREQDVAARRPDLDWNVETLIDHYRRMPEKELDEEFASAGYIATEAEKSVYASLSLEGKREFIARFWNKRDETPDTPHNEFRENYLARVAYTNKSFSGLRAGWKTDMGRVLLVYGSPNEIERMPSSSETRAHQIWKYFELEGGVDFVFVDIRGWGNFELVNSTARNELHDPNWERWLYVK